MNESHLLVMFKVSEADFFDLIDTFSHFPVKQRECPVNLKRRHCVAVVLTSVVNRVQVLVDVWEIKLCILFLIH